MSDLGELADLRAQVAGVRAKVEALRDDSTANVARIDVARNVQVSLRNAIGLILDDVDRVEEKIGEIEKRLRAVEAARGAG